MGHQQIADHQQVCMTNPLSSETPLYTIDYTSTVKLSETELGTLRLLWLGGIIENQNSDFVTP